MTDTLVHKVIHPYPKMRAHVVEGPAGVIALAWRFDRSLTGGHEMSKFFAVDGAYWCSDLGIHSRSPLYDWSKAEPDNKHCAYVDGPDWYDGTSLGAERVGGLYVANKARLGVAGAEELVFAELEGWYHSRFPKEDRS